MKRKGFTLVELLVVIGIIALLMSILMPALAKVKALANRMVCGTNLANIGKAMLLYSNYNDEEYPQAGGRNNTWGARGIIIGWDDPEGPDTAYGRNRGVTITSSFYLLIREYDMTPKSFVCRADIGTKVFKLSDFPSAQVDDITDAWDFGDGSGGNPPPGGYCSYSYHMPYRPGYPITATSSPASPLCADRNPYLDNNASVYLNGIDPDEDPPSWYGDVYYDQDKTGNSAPHRWEGQNVLFNDHHVSLEKYPNVGIDNDNIYRRWNLYNREQPRPVDDDEKQIGGVAPTGDGDGRSQSEKDAYLVNERQS